MRRNEIYEEKGFKTRSNYLYSLADEFDLDIETVYSFAKMLGKEYDFTLLIEELKNHCGSCKDKYIDELYEVE